ncbi:MAG: preprotein translocase subunit SecE [Flammeovirgaceae bacterium]
MFNKLISLIKESYNEMVHHVTWSPFKELQQSSILVLIASLIFALVIWVMDISFREGLDAFYQTFK